MAKYQSDDWKKLCEFAAKLTAIQNMAFNQISRDAIRDAATLDRPTDEIMPRIFALESIMISFGVIKDVADQLARPEVDYGEFNQQLLDVEALRDLSAEYGNRHPRAKQIVQIYDKHAEAIVAFVEKLNDSSEVVPRPYGGFMDFDMEVWALTCLIDLKDIYYGNKPIDPRKANDRALLARIETVISERIDVLRKVAGSDVLRRAGLIGWYGSAATMLKLHDTFDRNASKTAFAKRPSVVQAISQLEEKGGTGKKATIDDLLRSLWEEHGVVETTLLSTRAVCTFVVVAQDVLKSIDARTDEEEVRKESMLAAFAELETNVFRSDEFGIFCLNQLKKYQDHEINSNNIDAFVHLCGILAFGLSKGYFLSSDNPELFREVLVRECGFARGADVIKVIVRKFKQEVKSILGNRESLANTSENYFVATSDPSLLLDQDGSRRQLGKPELKETVEPRAEDGGMPHNSDRRHTFVYLIALPIVLKVFAQLAADERKARMTTTKQDAWKEIRFADWLEDVETLGSQFADLMVDTSLQLRGNEAHGTWRNEHDWSVTAAIVEALNIWCGALAYRVAFIERTGEGRIVDPPPTGDFEVFQQFLGVLQRNSTPPPAVSAESGKELEWVRALARLSKVGLGYYPHDRDKDTKSLNLQDVFKLSALAIHLADQLDVPLEEILREAEAAIRARLPEASSDKKVEARFEDIARDIEVRCSKAAKSTSAAKPAAQTLH